jgi:D-tyrosyl-tRNA(Tyr) deacylase
MKFLIQKVKNAKININNKKISAISRGLLVFIGISKKDLEQNNDLIIDYLVDKTINMRLFGEKVKGFEKSVKEIGGDILLVSQFTLYAKCEKGRRPSFEDAAPSISAEEIYNKVVDRFKNTSLNISTGVFGAKMDVKFVNFGPVTIMIEKSF